MSIAGRRRRNAAWRAASLTGVATSSFSTLVICLAARRIGRPVVLSWMEVATVALRGRAVRARPGPREVFVGIFVHQAADFAWAVTFYGLGTRWTRRLHPAAAAVLSPAWAAATQAVEYYVILPWLQPLLRMQVPYWVGLGAHAASGAAYPIYPWLRARAEGHDVAGAAFARRWVVLLGATLSLLAALEVLGRVGREPRRPGLSAPTREFDCDFMWRMAAHHEAGVRLALLAANRAERADLRLMGRLIAAEQSAEIDILRSWWRGWHGGELPPPVPEERAAMLGMPPPGTVQSLADLRGMAFEQRFVELMISHHEGAIAMAGEARRRAGDPRLRLFAAQIMHAQHGQVARMAALHPPVTDGRDADPATGRRAPTIWEHAMQ